jgi:hypothetical protein
MAVPTATDKLIITQNTPAFITLCEEHGRILVMHTEQLKDLDKKISTHHNNEMEQIGLNHQISNKIFDALNGTFEKKGFITKLDELTEKVNKSELTKAKILWIIVGVLVTSSVIALIGFTIHWLSQLVK